MKKFSFSLQRLLDYTEQVLDIERATLADMNAVLRGFVEDLENLKNEYSRRSREHSEVMMEGTTPLDLEMRRNYLIALDERIHNKKVQIEMQRRVVEKQTDKVRDTKMEISTMEKLRENKLEEYNALDQKEQELFIEEFVSNAKSRETEVASRHTRLTR